MQKSLSKAYPRNNEIYSAYIGPNVQKETLLKRTIYRLVSDCPKRGASRTFVERAQPVTMSGTFGQEDCRPRASVTQESCGCVETNPFTRK